MLAGTTTTELSHYTQSPCPGILSVIEMLCQPSVWAFSSNGVDYENLRIRIKIAC